VGKPSAGKSSFYNAATNAVSSKDGRRMAAVAAHPFTTIEPNIGPGFYPGPADNNTGFLQQQSEICACLCLAVVADGSRGALYGRDVHGRRLLPVIIKDVAGLVPGAYKGRGKGNQFLADLCDADVLIHVVDATGKSDKDGNVIHVNTANPNNSAEYGLSSPSEDCKWVREELHRWIHANVKCKWQSVTRKAKDKHIDRVVALFSGYQGSKSFTFRALQRAEITVGMLGTMSALDLHRLVAHFLSIRFPTVLALNKIDDFDDASAGRSVIQTCQEEAFRRGELAIPVCARAENWIQLKEVCKMNSNAAAVAATLSLSEQASQSMGILAADDSISSSDPDQQTVAASTRIVLPTAGSKLWLENELIVSKVFDAFPSTGTGILDALASALSLNPPTLCYPVCDLDSEMPVGWSPGETSAIHDINNSLKLRDCILLKPGSTGYHTFEALKKSALNHVIVHGDFVRAEGRSLDESSRKKQLGRDDEITSECCVLRVQTNRKSVWQQQFAAASAGSSNS
jgi:ribosome-binding ATPase YchF (GTP1/OBG family)